MFCQPHLAMIHTRWCFLVMLYQDLVNHQQLLHSTELCSSHVKETRRCQLTLNVFLSFMDSLNTESCRLRGDFSNVQYRGAERCMKCWYHRWDQTTLVLQLFLVWILELNITNCFQPHRYCINHITRANTVSWTQTKTSFKKVFKPKDVYPNFLAKKIKLLILLDYIFDFVPVCKLFVWVCFL